MFYRAELEGRYQLPNVRRFEEFGHIPDARINALRDFFLDRIYPPVEDRAELDFAIDHLGGVLRSPRRMRPLLGTALTGLWRMGHRLPAAVSAGLATVDAYRESRRLENILNEYAQERGLTLADAKRRESMVALIAGVPPSDVKRLINDILKLFHALSNIDMLRTAIELMELFIGTMKKNPSYFDEQDLAGVTLGRDIVRGGLELFEKIDPKDFPKIIKGIERVEFDWFERIQNEAKELAA
jgi:hypothetical protein